MTVSHCAATARKLRFTMTRSNVCVVLRCGDVCKEGLARLGNLIAGAVRKTFGPVLVWFLLSRHTSAPGRLLSSHLLLYDCPQGGDTQLVPTEISRAVANRLSWQ